MNLSQALSIPGMIPLKWVATQFNDPQTLALAEKELENFLTEASSQFDLLVTLPQEELNGEKGFEKLVEPYLNMDEKLQIGFTLVSHFNSCDASDALRKLIERFQPKLVEHGSRTSMSRPFYDRLIALQQKATNLTAAQKRSIALIRRDMEMSGVHLDDAKKQELQDLRLQMSQLAEKISNHALDSQQKFFHHLSDPTSLAEMPTPDLTMAEQEAKRRGLTGHVFILSMPSYLAIMRYCTDREVRRIFYEKWHSVATEGEEDNRPLVLETLKLRQKMAQILGFPNYAEYILQSRMVQSVATIRDTIRLFAEKSKIKAQQEIEELKKFSGLTDLALWDVTYWSEKLGEKKFQIDSKELRKYFPLEPTLQGLFGTAEKLYGLKFVPMKTDADEKIYEVREDGELISYFVLDLFARKGKRNGAWCNVSRYSRRTSDDARQIPIVFNVCNFNPGTAQEPALLPHSDVETLFHEFGHALHAMLSRNDYLNLHSFSVEWDFVELPSQIMENWTWHPDSLESFTRHAETGQPLDRGLLQRLLDKRSFMKGLMTLRQSEFGFMDMDLHTMEPPNSVEELDRVTQEIANRYTVLPKPKSYKMYASFLHLFAGGYGAGYYSYLWAEILEADAFQEFAKNGVFDPSTGKKFRKLLESGTSQPAAALFREFAGRDPDPKPLLKKKGLLETI